MPDINPLFIIGTILFLSSIVQGAIGFGYGPFAVTFLVWTGRSLSEAVAFVAVSVMIQVLVSTYQLRAHVPWKRVFPAAGIRLVALPVGIAILLTIDGLDRSQIKQVVGVIILVAASVQLLWKIEPQENLHKAWTYVAFSVSGLMQGMTSMGGPAAVLWVMAHKWTNQQSRGFLLALFMLGVPFQIAILYFTAHGNIVWAFQYGLVFAPLVALGAAIGVRLGNLISKQTLKRIAMTMLLITALASILGPLL
ncbi:sulfite exporter TauE/SafE family protein [Candidatus Neomarinimicrobiota bacterium]